MANRPNDNKKRRHAAYRRGWEEHARLMRDRIHVMHLDGTIDRCLYECLTDLATLPAPESPADTEYIDGTRRIVPREEQSRSPKTERKLRRFRRSSG